MISRKAFYGGMPPKKKSKKQSRIQCSRTPDKTNQKKLNKILNDLCVDEDEWERGKYMGIWTDVMARFDDTCLRKLSKMSNKELENYGISKDNYQYHQTQSDTTRFRKLCREAL
jgi:hypothetical protein